MVGEYLAYHLLGEMYTIELSDISGNECHGTEKVLLLTQKCLSDEQQEVRVRIFPRIYRTFSIPKQSRDLFLLVINGKEDVLYELIKLEEKNKVYDVASVLESYNIEKVPLPCNQVNSSYSLKDTILLYPQAVCIWSDDFNPNVCSHHYKLNVRSAIDKITDIQFSKFIINYHLLDCDSDDFYQDVKTFLDTFFEKGYSFIELFTWLENPETSATGCTYCINTETFAINGGIASTSMRFPCSDGEFLHYKLSREDCRNFSSFFEYLRPHLGKDTLAAHITRLQFLNS